MHIFGGLTRVLAIAMLAVACAPPQQQTPREERIAAALLLTRQCAASRLAKWNIHGVAAGPDCSVLLVETSMVLDDSLVEAIHYGTGPYAVVEGGVRQFTRLRAFRGVAYRDRIGRVRTYGDLTRTEAEELQPCR
jgi:hypothetical protein